MVLVGCFQIPFNRARKNWDSALPSSARDWFVSCAGEQLNNRVSQDFINIALYNQVESFARQALRLAIISALLQSPRDSRLVQIVGRHFHLDSVAHGQANPPLAHLPADRREHEVLIFQFHAEHCSGKHGLNAANYFDGFFFQLVHSAGLDRRHAFCRPAEPEAARDKESRPSEPDLETGWF